MNDFCLKNEIIVRELAQKFFLKFPYRVTWLDFPILVWLPQDLPRLTIITKLFIFDHGQIF